MPPPIPKAGSGRQKKTDSSSTDSSSTEPSSTAKPASGLTEGVTLLKRAAEADKRSKEEGTPDAERVSRQQEACDLYTQSVAVLDEVLRTDHGMKSTSRAALEAKRAEAAARIETIRRKIDSANILNGRETDPLKVAVTILKAGQAADTAAKQGDASKRVDAVRLYRQGMAMAEQVIFSGKYQDSVMHTLASKVVDVTTRLAVLEPQIPPEILVTLESEPASEPEAAPELAPEPEPEGPERVGPVTLDQPPHGPSPIPMASHGAVQIANRQKCEAAAEGGAATLGENDHERVGEAHADAAARQERDRAESKMPAMAAAEREKELEREQERQQAATNKKLEEVKAAADAAAVAQAEENALRERERQELEAAIAAAEKQRRKEEDALAAAAVARAAAEQQSAEQVERAVSNAAAAAAEAARVAAAAQYVAGPDPYCRHTRATFVPASLLNSDCVTRVQGGTTASGGTGGRAGAPRGGSGAGEGASCGARRAAG